jgi:hypothetical protein
MTSTDVETAPLATDVEVTADHLRVELADGRSISVPIGWFPRLLKADVAARSHWQLIGRGVGIHWPEIDEDISVAGLLRGERSSERS